LRRGWHPGHGCRKRHEQSTTAQQKHTTNASESQNKATLANHTLPVLRAAWLAALAEPKRLE
jgi:hypothetical protein